MAELNFTMVFTNIFGHLSAKELLQQQIASNNLSHAYLFLGPSGVGKYSMAKLVAQSITKNSTADIMELDLAVQDSIEDLREFIELISVRPVKGSYKVAIIDNFNLASLAISNALLKVLEEPSQSTFIFLISSQRPIATIVSRSQLINFNRLNETELGQYAASQHLEPTTEQILASGGSPGRLLEILNNNTTTEKAAVLHKQLSNFNSTVSDRLLAVAQWGNEDSSTLTEVFTTTLLTQKARLTKDPQLAKPMRKLMDSLELLKSNVNKKLVLQKLLL